jgi:ABC-type nitrate/sulfonate/bicarbonate transport system substrate-binding protein
MNGLTVSTFPNAKALPLWVGVEQGIFTRHGVTVTLHATGSSKEQRAVLASGEVDLVQSALDNAVEMIRTGEDVVILMGGEGGMNDFIVRPEIRSWEQLRGKIVAVDSPHTAYALIARKILADHGLVLDKDYSFRPVGNGSSRLRAFKEDPSIAGAVLNPPFSAEAELIGLRSLGRLNDFIGPYQAGGTFGLRHWVRDHEDAVVGYIAAYVEALDWLTAPANAAGGAEILHRRLGISDEIAAATLAQLCDPSFGFTPRAKLSHEGFENMLAIRNQSAGDDGLGARMRGAVDESFYDRAVAQ